MKIELTELRPSISLSYDKKPLVKIPLVIEGQYTVVEFPITALELAAMLTQGQKALFNLLEYAPRETEAREVIRLFDDRAVK